MLFCKRKIITERNKSNQTNEKLRNLFAYWIFGLCNNYGYVVMLSAANDILHKQEDQTEEQVNKSLNYWLKSLAKYKLISY